MNNLGIRVHATDGAGGIWGYVSLTLAGQMVVTGIKIREGAYGKFLCMPSRKVDAEKGYMDYFYASDRNNLNELTTEVLKVYEEAVKAESKNAMTTAEITELPVDVGVVLTDNGNEHARVTCRMMGKYILEGVTVRYRPDQDIHFVCMPSYRNKDGEYKDYAFMLSKEQRSAFNESILEAFAKARAEAAEKAPVV